jgi:adenylate cyclase
MPKEHAGAAGVVIWLMREGRHITHMREFGDEMCRRIVAAGIPIQRAFCSTKTLHPEVYGTAYVWRRDQPGAERLTAMHGFQRTDEMVTSPVVAVEKSGVMLRRRLCDANCPMDFPLLAEFKSAGATDYLALPLKYSSGEINSITFSTDRAVGFTEAEVAGLADVAEALAIIVEVQSTRRIARHLMDTYVGHRTGERVLSGAITRGAAQTIHAVIWFCDLRGFTALADSLPRDRLIAMLNDYFEAMVAAVTGEAGEALKFMGDGLLAIFELGDGDDPSQRCAAALRAANTASEKIAARNIERRAAGEPEIRFGLALHLGEVSYGNIGAPSRLDFTVIGPAVNHAARLEKIASELGRHVVTSASFAVAAGTSFESLGKHQLRGVTEPQEVFAPAMEKNQRNHKGTETQS